MSEMPLPGGNLDSFLQPSADADVELNQDAGHPPAPVKMFMPNPRAAPFQ